MTIKLEKGESIYIETEDGLKFKIANLESMNSNTVYVRAYESDDAGRCDSVWETNRQL